MFWDPLLSSVSAYDLVKVPLTNIRDAAGWQAVANQLIRFLRVPEVDSGMVLWSNQERLLLGHPGKRRSYFTMKFQDEPCWFGSCWHYLATTKLNLVLRIKPARAAGQSSAMKTE